MHWPSAHGALYAPRSRGEPVIGQCFIVATAFPTLLSPICIRPDQMCIYAVGGRVARCNSRATDSLCRLDTNVDQTLPMGIA